MAEVKISIEPGLITEPPAQVQNTNPAPVTRTDTNQNQNLPIKESGQNFMNLEDYPCFRG